MRTPTGATGVEPEVLVRGDVPAGQVEEAVAMLRATCAKPPRPVLFARLTLTMAPDAVGEQVDRIRRGMRRLHGDHP